MGIFKYSPLVQRLEGRIGSVVFENSLYGTPDAEALGTFVFRSVYVGPAELPLAPFVFIFGMLIANQAGEWDEDWTEVDNNGVIIHHSGKQ